MSKSGESVLPPPITHQIFTTLHITHYSSLITVLGISLLPMLRQIESHRLTLGIDARRYEELQSLEQEYGRGRGDRPDRHHRDDLGKELIGVPVKQPIAAIGVHRSGGKQAGRQHAPCAADRV